MSSATDVIAAWRVETWAYRKKLRGRRAIRSPSHVLRILEEVKNNSA
jgi:hypothetical protein